ncbi:MAG TPA: bifunctional diaminohydroxyphosphoribosylaminopyrimidine deaminase/5-amino-6-(5-phosphoribosylamino)uracil reductase RibD [Halieaceae bacterium]|nr:bifunctional diaminohydroxyphosphoribosylaminopyrimidine deaminase/5-amino-6-(5-phosphoribosylamino)uracil reductase RibD [Halieaceae bacterium]
MSFSAFDHRCMATALQLASHGMHTTHPNPRVGCVIASNEKVVGKGWHKRAGDAHAEINALADAGDKAGSATAYVTLEPCSHSGKTPPCVDALIEAKITRVVCALEDPNPEVSGDGIERLRQAGIEVQVGLMAAQAEEQNAGFLMRMRHGRPWVRIKLAQSMDGHIALSDGSSQWISGPEARADVQRWRARSDAILTGVGTVLADDPSLNVRNEENARQPLRVMADSHWRTPPDARLLGLAGEVLIAGLNAGDIPAALADSAAELVVMPAVDDRVDLRGLLQELGRRGINEVQVEAGAVFCGALMQQGLVDEVLIYQAPVLLGGGAVSPFATPRLDNMDDRVHLKWIDSRRIGNDMRLRLRPVYQEK